MEKRVVELYVANPPTEKCRELIDLAEKTCEVVQKELDGEIELKVWKRGEPSSRTDHSTAVVSLIKESVLPGVIVDGKIKFTEEVPDEETLKKAILSPETVSNVDFSSGGN